MDSISLRRKANPYIAKKALARRAFKQNKRIVKSGAGLMSKSNRKAAVGNLKRMHKATMGKLWKQQHNFS